MHSLEELLEEIKGPRNGEEKLANQEVPTGDLIDRLLKYAAAGAPANETDSQIREAAHRELVEKTAQIGIIALTIAELEQAVATPGVKTAAAAAVDVAHKRTAIFVKRALEKGHSEREIAEFLQKRAAGGLASRAMEVAKGVGRKAGETSHLLASGGTKAWSQMTPEERKRAILMPTAGAATGFLTAALANKLTPSKGTD
jgi:hypothetical protein